MSLSEFRVAERGKRSDPATTMTGRSIALFAAAALAEIGGAYLIWIGLREARARWRSSPAP